MTVDLFKSMTFARAKKMVDVVHKHTKSQKIHCEIIVSKNFCLAYVNVVIILSCNKSAFAPRITLIVLNSPSFHSLFFYCFISFSKNAQIERTRDLLPLSGILVT